MFSIILLVLCQRLRCSGCLLRWPFVCGTCLKICDWHSALSSLSPSTWQTWVISQNPFCEKMGQTQKHSGLHRVSGLQFQFCKEVSISVAWRFVSEIGFLLLLASLTLYHFLSCKWSACVSLLGHTLLFLLTG